MKILAGLLAFISGFFTGNSPRSQPPAILNTAVIAYNQTYFAPAVAEPGNLPWAKKVAANNEETIKLSSATPPTQIPPSPPPPSPAPAGNPYLAIPEPAVDWYVPITIQGKSIDGNGTLPEMIFEREFWRIEVLAYWAPGESIKLPVEKDYFKLEVYEKGTDKLIYTMTSGTEDTIHKFQAFKKPGTYYFKTYLTNPSQFEITFTHSLKMAQ